jgi:hypothetical protein
MKQMLIAIILIFGYAFGSSAYSQEWIAYQNLQPPPQVQVVHSVQYQPVVVYQWVPYVVQQNVVVEQQCLFRRTQTIITKPTIQWILQPVVIYR